MLSNFEERVLKTITDYRMLDDTDCVIAGISGGVDSSVLLNIFYKISITKEISLEKNHNNFKIFVIHVNHMLRGDEAFRDENFVKNLCKKFKIDFHVSRIDVKSIAKSKKLGLEECGRNVRYDIFREFVQKFEKDGMRTRIALAHNLNDSMETIFMNIGRGCGLRGLCGIAPTRDKIVRPLIHVSRNEIEDYADENNIEFVNDSTNFCDLYTRNKIRMQIIPKFKEVFPNVERKMLNLLKNISQDEIFLEDYTNNMFESCKIINNEKLVLLDTNKLKNVDSTILNRIAIKFFEVHGIKNFSEKHVQLLKKVLQEPEKSFSLPNDFFIKNSQNIIKISKKNILKHDLWQYNLSDLISSSKYLTRSNWHVKIRRSRLSNLKSNEFSLCGLSNFIDFHKLPTGCVLRNRRAGDRFVPFKKSTNRFLRKFLNESKMPIDFRDEVPLIAHKSDVFWIGGIGVGDLTKISQETKIVLQIIWRRC